MVETTATLNIQGTGNLARYLEEINAGMANLAKSTSLQERSFSFLNNTGRRTEDLFRSLRDTGVGLINIAENTKQTFFALGNAARTTIAVNDTLENARKGASGLALSFLGLKDEVVAANKVLEVPAKTFKDIAKAQTPLLKAFVILEKVQKPVTASLKFVANQTEKLEKSFRNLGSTLAAFSQVSLKAIAKGLASFSKVLENLSSNEKSFGFLSKLSTIFDASAKSANKFLQKINPEQFEEADEAGQKLAETFDKVGKNLDMLAKGVAVTAIFGSIVRLTAEVKEFGTAIAQTTGDTLFVAKEIGTKVLPVYTLLHTKLQMVAHASGVLAKVMKSSLLGAFSEASGNLAMVGLYGGVFVTLADSAKEALMQMRGLNDAFAVMQNLGIDTTAAEISFQLGTIGERLIFNAEAAKQFGQTAISAFAALEDASAFVTTISAGANFQFDNLNAGVESISAAMIDLVTGPLKNSISSIEAANALYNALSAGVGIAADGTVRLGEVNNFLAASLKLAAGSGSDAAQTLELLAKTSKVYGLSNTEAATTAAKLYQIVEQGITTFPELTGVLGNVFAVAKSVGVSMEEAGGAIGALTRVMGSAEAATGLQSLLASIAGQGEEAQQVLNDLGIRFDVNTVRTKGLINSLNELYKATGGNASQLKDIIPDITAFRTALTLMTASSEDAVAITKSLGEAGEEDLEKLFNRRQQSTIQQFTLLMNGFNEVLADFGRRVLPSFQPKIEFLQGFLDFLKGLPDPVKNAIGVLVVTQTALSNFGGGLVNFLMTMGKAIAAVAAFRLVMKGAKLFEEFKILGAINQNGIDFAGTLLRLVGLNEKLDLETAKVNATLKEQQNILKALAKQKINVGASIDNIEALKQALDQVKQRLKNLRETGIKSGTDKGFDQEVKSLERLEKRINGVLATTRTNRKGLFSDLKTTVDKTLSSTILTIEQKKVILQRNLELFFSTFSTQGLEAKEEIKKVLNDVDLTISQKVAKINEIFDDLGAKALPNAKENFEKVRLQIVKALEKIDISDPVNRLKKLPIAFEEVLRRTQDKAEQMRLAEILNEALTDAKSITKEKVKQLEQVFDRLSDNVPEETKESLQKLKGYFVNTFDDLKNRVPPEAKALVEKVNSKISEISGIRSVQEFKQYFTETFEELKTKIPPEAEVLSQRINSELQRVSSSEELIKLKSHFISTFDELKQRIPPEAGKLVDKINLKLREISGSDIVQRVGNNVRRLTQQIEINTNSINRSLGKFNSVGNLISNFVPGLSGALGVMTDLGDVIDDFAPNLGNSAKGMTMLSAGLGSLNVVGAAAASALGTLGSVIAGVVAAAAPFVAAAAAIGVALYGIHNALKVLIPAYGVATDSTLRLADGLKKSSSQILESAESINKLTTNLQALKKEQNNLDPNLGLLPDVKLEKLMGLTEEEIRQMRQKTLASIVPEEKEFLQGWRSPIINLLEFIDNSFSKIGAVTAKFLPQAAKSTADVLEKTFAKVPGVSKWFDQFGDFFDRLIFKVDKRSKDLEKGRRSFFNNLRRNIQDRIAAPAREAAAESLESTKALISSTDELNDAYKYGGVAYKESNNIIKAAFAERKALSATELKTVLENERNLNEAVREEINKTIEKKQQELANAKDPVVRESIEKELELLNQRNQELEKGLELQETYLANQNTILSNNDANLASSGLDQLEERIGSLYAGLSSEAQQYFKSSNVQFDPAIKAQIDKDKALLEENEKILQERIKLYGQGSEEVEEQERIIAEIQNRISSNEKKLVTGVSGNLVNSVQRRAEAAFQAASASFAQLQADLNDPEKNINVDQIATGLFNVLDSIDKKVAEKVITLEEGERAKQEFLNKTLKVEIDGQVTEVLAKNVLRPDQLVTVEESFIEGIRQNSEKIIAAKEDQLTKIQALNEQGLLSDAEASKQIAQVNQEIGQQKLTEEEKVLERMIELYGNSSEVVVEQQRKVEGLRAQIAADGYKDRQKIFEDELAELELSRSEAASKLQALSETQVISEIEAAKQIAEINEKSNQERLQKEEQYLEELKRTYPANSKAVLEQERRVKELRNQIAIEGFKDRQQIFDAELKDIERIKNNELSKIKALSDLKVISEVDAARQIADVNAEYSQKRLAQEEKLLNDLIIKYGENAESVKLQQKNVELLKYEIAVEGFNDRKKILEEELNLLTNQKDNELKVLENAATKSRNLLDLKSKTMTLDQSALEAQADLSRAISDLESARLENKLKLSTDIEDKARIELEIAEKRLVILEKEQAFERENLIMQQELNKISLERENIELNLQKAQIETEKALAKQRLARAKELGMTKEEEQALRLQIEAYQLQEQAIIDSQKQLAKQSQTQEIINQKQLKSLQLRQEAARETSAADIELAKLAQIQAAYEKQSEQLQLQVKLAEIAGEERLQNLESQTNLIDKQTQVFQKQAELIKKTAEMQDAYYGLAKDVATTEIQRRRIEREHALARQRNLEKIQSLEMMNLKIQQMQEVTAQKRQQIELDIAKVKQEAALAEAQAEAAKLRANPKATKAEIMAADLNIKAQQIALEGMAKQQNLLAFDSQLSAYMRRLEEENLQTSFRFERLQAARDVAATTLTRGDDRRISNIALNEARGQGYEFVRAPMPDMPAAPVLSGFPDRLEVVLRLQGTTEVVNRIDDNQLNKVLSDGLYQGLNELFSYASRSRR